MKRDSAIAGIGVTSVLKKPRLEAVVASWRFQHGSLPEFSAEIKDKEFLRAKVW